MFVCCECYVLSGRGLCVGLITRPEESYRVGLSERDRESPTVRRPWVTGGLLRHGIIIIIIIIIIITDLT
jgi:hypothetical protein